MSVNAPSPLPTPSTLPVQVTISKSEIKQLSIGSGTLDILKNIVDSVKSKKIEINMIIVNSRFYIDMFKEGLYTQQAVTQNSTLSIFQIWKEIRIVFSPFVEDWYIVPTCKWYNQKIEGINEIAIASEL
jgi:hypothetical protein